MADPNASAFAVLDDKIAQFRFKVADVPEAVVADVAKIIDDEQHRTMAAGQDAYGKPWQDKKDGQSFKFAQPFDVTTGALGRVIITRIRTRHTVLHHLGVAKGYKGGGREQGAPIPARQVIPVDGKIPTRWSERIRERVLRAFREATA